MPPETGSQSAYNLANNLAYNLAYNLANNLANNLAYNLANIGKKNWPAPANKICTSLACRQAITYYKPRMARVIGWPPKPL